MKRIITFMAVLLTLSFSGGVFAKASKNEQPPATTNVKSELVELVAKVKAIDYDKRSVELEGPSGNLVKIKVSDDVKNFKQIKKGDDVVVKYSESLIWTLKKKGAKEAPASLTTSASTASPGQKPAVDKSSTLDLVATIKAIDKKIPSVTLMGPEGNTMAVKVKDPQNLEGVKVGDQVAITYTESLAVAVEKAPKK